MQDDTGIDVEPSDGLLLPPEHLIGWDLTISHLIAAVELAEEPECGLRREALGFHSSSRMVDGGPVRRCDFLERTHKRESGWAATC